MPRYIIVGNTVLKDWQYSLPPKALWLKLRLEATYQKMNLECLEHA